MAEMPNPEELRADMEHLSAVAMAEGAKGPTTRAAWIEGVIQSTLMEHGMIEKVVGLSHAELLRGPRGFLNPFLSSFL